MSINDRYSKTTIATNHKMTSDHVGGDSWSVISYFTESATAPCIMRKEYRSREAELQTALHWFNGPEPQDSGKADV